MLAGELVDNLMEQIKQFEPGFTLAETATTLNKLEDGTFEVITNKGTVHCAKSCSNCWWFRNFRAENL